MAVFWLSEDKLAFPSPHLANKEGILAVGGDLAPDRLILAYRSGIFPWFNEDDPILWWSPDPRFVLFPKDLKVSKSMRPYFNQKKFRVTFDQEFEVVIEQCRSPRKGQGFGTWITNDMVKAYCQLHKMGYAHSVEVWQEDELVGGLYGIALGRCFYGESMFTHVSNASKFGFVTLVKKLDKLGFWLIDCQQQTKHLRSLGAVAIPRERFLEILKKNETETTLTYNWQELMEKIA